MGRVMGPSSRLAAIPRPLRDLTVAVLFAGIYLLVAKATREVGPTNPALLWAPSGIYMGVMILSDRRLWPLLALAALGGAFGANMLEEMSPAESIAFAVPSGAEGLLGALILMRLTDDRFSLSRLRDVVALIFGAAVLANALTALSAAAASVQAFNAPFAESWLRWWGADALGILVITPILVALVPDPPRLPARSQLRELAFVAACFGGIAYFLSVAEPLGAATVVAGAAALPLLLWVSWRWSPQWAALGVLVPALVGTYLAPDTVDPLGLGTIAGTELLVTQVFLGTLAIASLAFGAVAAERRSADGLLAGVRGRLDRVVTTAPDAYVSIDDEGLITEWSPRAERLLGWSRDDALGRRLHETVVPESGREAWIAEVERRAVATDLADQAPLLTALRKDGTELPVALTISPSSPEDPNATHLFIRNLSERERFRKELRETWDLVSRKAGELAHSEERAGRLEEGLAHRTQELEDAREEARRDLEAAAGERARLEAELEAAAGQRARLEAELETAGSERGRLTTQIEAAATEHRRLETELGEARQQLEAAAAEKQRLEGELAEARQQLEDERERLRAELERAEQERAAATAAAERERHELTEAARRLTGERDQLKRALDAMVMSFAEADRERMLLARRATDIVIRYDRLGICRYASPACVDVLGYEPSEMAGKRAADLVHADDRMLFHQAMAAADDTTFRARLMRKDGSAVQVESRFFPVREEESGRLVSVEAAVRPVPDEAADATGRDASAARFDATFAKAPIGMALLDRAGGIRDANPALCRLSGYSREQLGALGMSRLVGAEERGELETALLQLAAGERAGVSAEQGLVRADGRVVRVSLSVSPVHNREQHPIELVAQVQDLSEKVQSREELRRLTDHDPLTGLYSPGRFEEEVRTELAAAERYGTEGAVLAVNLDRFTSLNGLVGRARGDEIIRSVAYALRRRLRSTDVAGRTGGDQFAILLRRADAGQAAEAAGALLDAVRDVGRAGPGGLTASIGIATFGKGRAVRAEELLVESEIAVQDAKHAGGDRIMAHDAERDRPAITEGLGWADQIRAAIAEGRFELQAEPVVGIGDNGQPRHELLPRMRSAGGELVPTASLMPAAERFGLAGGVDRWLLRSAIAVLARAGSGARIEVSLSTKAPSDPDLPGFIAEELRKVGAEPAGLALSIAESAAMHGTDRTSLFLRRLADIGCEVGLDRFGAGVASFLHVDRLPVSYVKLDPDLVAGLVGSESARLVAKSIADVARGLGLRTVAPGVSDDETLQLLRGIGVGYAQGPAVAPARPVTELRLSRPPEQSPYGIPSSSA